MNSSLIQLYHAANMIRKSILNVAHYAPSDGVHISPALSMVDVLTVLYGSVMRYQPDNITDKQRDFFILSKGHGALCLYAALYNYQIISEAELNSYEINGSVLQVHPTLHKEFGIDFSGGSLGHGMSFAIGLALSRRLQEQPWHTYVLVGDGECNEGAIWEGAFMAAHNHLDNLTVIVDHNGLQLDGHTNEVMRMDLPALWQSSGWHTIVCDGHNHLDLLAAFMHPADGRPKVIIANTIKGKGVSFMENNKEFHRNRLSEKQMQQALAELEHQE